MICSCSSMPTAVSQIHFYLDELTIGFTTRSPVSVPTRIL